MYPCMRSVHLVHVEPYSACVHVHVCARVCAYVYVCMCTPEHKLGCGQWTEDGGAGSRGSAATLATEHPPSPATHGAKCRACPSGDDAISTSSRKWRGVKSFTRGHRAHTQRTGDQADDNERRPSPRSLPLPSGSRPGVRGCTLGRGLLLGPPRVRRRPHRQALPSPPGHVKELGLPHPPNPLGSRLLLASCLPPLSFLKDSEYISRH